jgi:cyclic beta-1,2-glucan synthetase
MFETRFSEARQEGIALARRHTTGGGAVAPRRVQGRVRSLDRRFQALYDRLREGPPGSVLPARAEDWLLQNDHVVGEGLDRLAEALSPAFCRRLPQIRDPDGPGSVLRVEALTRDRVAVARGRLDLTEVMEFLRGYQEVHLLTLGELWALPAFLRLSLLEWLDRELAGILDGSGDPDEVRDGGGRVGGGIVSLRALGAEDWRSFVEELSAVEGILREDPAGVHGRMDFRTRDRYRHAVEAIARRSGRTEEEVARVALELARREPEPSRRRHVGYFLVAEGREALFRALDVPIPLAGTPSRRRRWGGVGYFGGIAGVTLGFLVALHAWLPAGTAGVLLLLLVVLPLLGVSVSVVNWVVARFVGARTLPRMDFREGIPREYRTVVAVPMLLTTPEDIRGVVHTLEVNYQANPDPALTFALLSDHTDADEARLPGDDTLLEVARSEIARLNRLYGEGEAGPFLLLHRGRRFNPGEGRWMGWERKRGKLHDLNSLLLGHPSELWLAEGDGERLQGVPFVLTLDADTLLPRGAAPRLVGTLAHPLNRPKVGPGGRIRTGYSVLQPRLEILPEAGGGSPFLRIFGGVQGLDLYAHAAFDVYQDLFDEGIFAGKGIYDVAAFEASLSGRVPDNTILSHDLFEGSHGRAGLVSDVILLEDFPGHPLVHARRAHRWVRGDWQLLPWLAPRVPMADGRKGPNVLSLLSRWKIAGQPPAVPPAAGPPPLPGGVVAVLPRGGPGRHPAGGGRDGAPGLLLPGDRPAPGPGALAFPERPPGRGAGPSPGAEPEPPGAGLPSLREPGPPGCGDPHPGPGPPQPSQAPGVDLRRGDGPGPGRPVLPGQPGPGDVGGTGPGGGPPPLPLVPGSPPVRSGRWRGGGGAVLLLWFLAPALAWLVSRPPRSELEPEGRFDETDARRVARRTWGFFERFQTPESHWLPPDNYQEDPNGEVAQRTSPTNIGLALVSAVVAWDLGFVDSSRLITRVRNTALGMDGLPRYRGHFLNWYQTHRQEALSPVYVSTVDSGNLAASLLVTREALRDVRASGLRPGLRGRGLLDTLRVLADVVREGDRDGTGEALRRATEDLVRWGEGRLGRGRGLAWGLAGAHRGVDPDPHRAPVPADPALEARILSFVESATGSETLVTESVVHWLGHLRTDVAQALDEAAVFAPWTRRGWSRSGRERRRRSGASCRSWPGASSGSIPPWRSSPSGSDACRTELRRSMGRDPHPRIQEALDGPGHRRGPPGGPGAPGPEAGPVVPGDGLLLPLRSAAPPLPHRVLRHRRGSWTGTTTTSWPPRPGSHRRWPW